MACHILHLELGFVMSIVGCTVGAMIQLIIPSYILIKNNDTIKGRCLLTIGLLVIIIGLFVTLSSAVCSNRDTEFCDSMGM